MSNFWRFTEFRSVVAVGGFLLSAGIQQAELNAQVATAAISGSVLDSSGAAVAKAQITVSRAETGSSQSTMSDSRGRFEVPNLPIGTYEVRATKPGFSTIIHSGITLTVGSNVVVDLTVQVGQQSQSVQVSGQVSQVETSSSEMGSRVDQAQMRELPLNGRSLEQLILLAPGVQSYSSNGQSLGILVGSNGGYSVGGARPEGQALLIDGENTQAFWNRGMGSPITGISLGIEGVAEFQVLTNSYSAQYGGNGAVMNSVTKSGTNTFHGSLFEFLRNSALDARNFFDGPSVPPFRRNQFGGSVGGPVKRDRAFFFFNYEGLRESLGQTRIAVVPDANARNGFLPIGPNGSLVDVGVSPNTVPLMNFFKSLPLPAQSSGGVGTISSVGTQVTPENYYLGRFDYAFSEKDSLFVRYINEGSNGTFPFSGGAVPVFPEVAASRNQFSTIHERHIIPPTLINLTRLSFSRPTLSDTHPNTEPAFDFLAGRPMGILSVAGLGSYGGGYIAPFGFFQNRYAIGEDVIWSRGSHNIKFGADITKFETNVNYEVTAGGFYLFTGLETFLAGTPSEISTLAPGNSYTWRSYSEFDFNSYIQDDWKVTSRLTVTLGLRYSFYSNPTDKYNNLFEIINPLVGSSYQHVDHVFVNNPGAKMFDPRFGFAFDVFGDHKTAIRGGFALSHDPITPFVYGAGLPQNPPSVVVTQIQPSFPTPFVGSSPTAPPPSNSIAVNPLTNRTAYLLQYNLNIERQLGASNVLNVGYVATHGVHLLSYADLNPPVATIDASGTYHFATVVNGQIVTNPRLNPAIGAMNYSSPYGYSNYNSLQASFNRRFASNVTVQVSYTYSHCIDNANTFGGFQVNSSGSTENPYDYSLDKGRCPYDIRHALRINGLWMLPFRGNALREGWKISAIQTVFTGTPVNIWDGFDLSGLQNETGGGSEPRPNGVANCPNQIRGRVGQWFNPNCFTLQAPGTLGNLGRNVLSGPGLVNTDLAVMKNTRVRKISGQFAVQFRAELFNIFNHANFGTPNGALSNSTFGLITSTAGTSRQIQFGLKVLF